ncbi:purine-cytosine permease family protein [Phaeacidiphilus oryzae]|uniref:purine-cytosine permease family protein n=1 Tax=Phaeacidiphilus oryzae TaxID=348818 RepID=UPI000561805F|nr:histidine kinase [Phaeacidiphilus oryzae]
MGLADNPAMEDCSLRYAPRAQRSWSPGMIFLSCLVGLSAMAGYALDAAFVGEYGFGNALGGFAVATLICVPLTVVIAFHIAREHIDIDLLTRGSGFGYLGSTVTSLVYASYTLIFLAYEGAIMAQAVTALTGGALDVRLSYAVVSVAMVPLTLYGMSFSTRFQAWTWPLWAALIVLAVVSAVSAPHAWHAMTALHGPATGAIGLSTVAVFAIAAAQLSTAAQIGEQGDYLRFMPDPEPTRRSRRIWRLAVVFGGPGLSLFFIVVFFASTLLVGYAQPRIGATGAMVPVDLFTSVYQRVTGSHTLALILSGVLVLVSQIKINIMNTYSGSLSWSNFFSRLLHRHPGRAAWVFLQVGLSLVLMESGIFAHITTVLAWYANIGIAWIGAMTSDLVVNKRWLRLSPPGIEFKRAHLYHVNPVGFGSMVLSGSVAMAAYYGAFGHTAAALSAFVALILALVLPPLLALATRGRWYLARTSTLPAGEAELRCAVCEETFDVPDMAACPVHEGAICSLCCSTDATCHDACKPSPWRPVGGGPPPTVVLPWPTARTAERLPAEEPAG